MRARNLNGMETMVGCSMKHHKTTIPVIQTCYQQPSSVELLLPEDELDKELTLIGKVEKWPISANIASVPGETQQNTAVSQLVGMIIGKKSELRIMRQ